MNQETNNTIALSQIAVAQGTEDVKRFTIDLPGELHATLKMKAAMMRMTMRDYVIAIIETSLQEASDAQKI